MNVSVNQWHRICTCIQPQMPRRRMMATRDLETEGFASMNRFQYAWRKIHHPHAYDYVHWPESIQMAFHYQCCTASNQTESNVLLKMHFDHKTEGQTEVTYWLAERGPLNLWRTLVCHMDVTCYHHLTGDTKQCTSLVIFVPRCGTSTYSDSIVARECVDTKGRPHSWISNV